MFINVVGNDVAESIRIGNTVHVEFCRCSRSLYFERAEVEKCRNHPPYFNGHILYLLIAEARDFSAEKSALFNIYDTFVGKNPNVEVVVRPHDKAENPDDKGPIERQEHFESRLGGNADVEHACVYDVQNSCYQYKREDI